MTVAEFHKPFPSDGHRGCLLSSALTKLYCIITELEGWHEPLTRGGLEAGWDRMNCCSHVSQTSLGSDCLCASLPCKTRGKTQSNSTRGPHSVVCPLDWQFSMESLCNGIPSLTWQWGNILGTHLSSLRRKLQCGRSTGFGSQERGLSLSSAFYLCVHWSHLCTSEPFFFLSCKMGIIVPTLCFEAVMQ